MVCFLVHIILLATKGKQNEKPIIFFFILLLLLLRQYNDNNSFKSKFEAFKNEFFMPRTFRATCAVFRENRRFGKFQIGSRLQSVILLWAIFCLGERNKTIKIVISFIKFSTE